MPVSEKHAPTVEEAALFSNIGQHRITAMLKQPFCPFALAVGNGRGKMLVKRKKFDDYLDNQKTI